MTGTLTDREIARALATISVIVRSPRSGYPRAAAVPKPLMYTASKPAAAASFACRQSNTNGATIISGPASKARSRDLCSFIGRRSLNSGEVVFGADGGDVELVNAIVAQDLEIDVLAGAMIAERLVEHVNLKV